MARFFTNTYPSVNLYKKASSKSEIVTQIIYGDSFFIIKKTINGLKLELKKIITWVSFKIKIIALI